VAKKPPLSLYVKTIDSDGKIVESVTVFEPKQLRREGMEEARSKAAVLKRRRLAVVYSVVKDDIGKMSDDKCADLHFSAVNTMLRQVVHDIAVDISRKESDDIGHKECNDARRRAERNAVQKILALYRTKSALAKTVARIRKRLSVR
jgi:hypothetical protein